MLTKPTKAELDRQTAEDWKKATISDGFIFNRVMMDKEILRPTLQRILPSLGITDIERINTELTIKHTKEGKGFRLDVIAVDDQQRTYDIEMQVVNQHNIVERSLAYFAGMVEEQLESGDEYQELRPLHVIFLTKFDPLGHNLQFDQLKLFSPFTQREPTDPPLLVFTYIDVSNDQESTPPAVRSLCRFINDGTVDSGDPYILKLKERETFAKQNAEWRNIYMHIDLNLKLQEWEKNRAVAEASERNLKLGREEGLAEGQQKLISQMVDHLTSLGDDKSTIIAKLVDNMGFTPQQAEELYQQAVKPA